MAGIFMTLFMLFVNLIILAPIDGFRMLKDGELKGILYFISLALFLVFLISLH